MYVIRALLLLTKHAICGSGNVLVDYSLVESAGSTRPMLTMMIKSNNLIFQTFLGVFVHFLKLELSEHVLHMVGTL